MTAKRARIAILISGRGSNMEALIGACRQVGYPAEVAVVIASREEAAGLAFAHDAGIATAIVSKTEYPAREDQEAQLDALLAEHEVGLICLAGWMRLMSAAFTTRWAGRMLNIHPSLLPLFKGLHPHRQALEAGIRIHGCSVHFVTAETDGGPIVAQAAVPVHSGDDEAALAARVLKVEHRLYPMALRLIAEGRVWLKDGRIVARAERPQEAEPLFSPSLLQAGA